MSEQQELLDLYRRSLDGFQEVVEAVSADRWAAPSACDDWSLADVVGHVVWGQWFIRALATGDDWNNRDGAPGAPHPHVLLNDDPLGAFSAARDAAAEVLTPDALDRTVEIGGPFGAAPLGRFARALAVVDTPAHTWDVGAPAGLDVRLDRQLVSEGDTAAHAMNMTRDIPGGVKAPLTPPPGADPQTCFLAYLGRRAW